MKILRLTAENIKKIKVVDIAPDGSVVQITGPNGSGKSSVLDCIWFALGGTRGIDSRPVRTGTLKAKIKLDLGEIIVTRSFTREGGTSLIVEAENGARFPSPQKMLDDLLGSLTFDPLAFSRMESKAQLDVLRGMVQLDVDIDELDRLNAADYQERTEWNRRAKALGAEEDAITVSDDLPDEAIDEPGLLDRMTRASEVNNGIERARRLREQRVERIERLQEHVTDLADQLADARAILRNEQEVVSQQVSLPELEDVAEIRSALESARIVNEAIAWRTKRESLKRDFAAACDHIDGLTNTMNARAEQKAAAIAAADMPIDGLSFGDGEVLYNGLPFSQASSAEQLRVSVAIAMAANPKLRVLRIKDGSLLDEHSLAMIAEMASDNDYQVWIERVDTTGKVGVVMEDGAIVGAEDHELALAGADEE